MKSYNNFGYRILSLILVFTMVVSMTMTACASEDTTSETLAEEETIDETTMADENVDDLKEYNSVKYDLSWIDRIEEFDAFMDDL